MHPFPIPDGGITSVDRMRWILDAIDLSLSADRAVYVHCFGGMGRTGTTVCCWLLRHKLASTENLLELLTHLRRTDVEQAGWKAPEKVRFSRMSPKKFVAAYNAGQLHWSA